LSNNVVFLAGWLQVERIETIPLNGSCSGELAIHASLYTDKAYLGGKHPLLLSGQPAQIALDWARQSDPKSGLPQVIVQGQLISRQESTLVHVKFIRFLGALDPAVQTLLSNLAQIVAQKNDAQIRPALLDLLHQNRDLAEAFQIAMQEQAQ
jgi:hypothetical protein